MNALRKIFAQISLDKLDPDLVIMDEFQRFRDLISPSDDEQGMLSRQFLQNTDTKVLLLSATPYKPYSTLEEINADESTVSSQVKCTLFRQQMHTFSAPVF